MKTIVTEERKRKVYDYLMRNHVGKDNMIKNKNIRFYLGLKIGDKSMRKIVQDINDDTNYITPICSVSGATGGFYIPETIEEVEETIKNRTRRADEIYKNCKMLEWKKLQMQERMKTW